MHFLVFENYGISKDLPMKLCLHQIRVHFLHSNSCFSLFQKFADEHIDDDIEDIPRLTQQKVLKNFSQHHGYYMKGLDHRALLFDGGDHYTVRHHMAAQVLHRAFAKFRTRALLHRCIQQKLHQSMLKSKESPGRWEHSPNTVRCIPADRRDQKSYMGPKKGTLGEEGKVTKSGTAKIHDVEKSDLRSSDTEINEETDDDAHDDSLL